jgi:hypothetical protein
MPQEEKWLKFMNVHSTVPFDCDIQLVEAAFRVMQTLPVRSEIKHEIPGLIDLVCQVQVRLGIAMPLKPTWKQTSEAELHNSLNAFNHLLLARGIGEAQERLFRVIFTFLKEFVTVPNYNGQVR